jgi:hypothetical protein
VPSFSYLTCSECDDPTQVRPKSHSYTCSSCHTTFDAIRCGRCHHAYLTDKPAWSSSKCPSCGSVEKRRHAADATFGEIKGLLTTERPSNPEKPAPPPSSLPSLGKYLEERGGLLGRIGRRLWPLAISTVFVGAALLYCFRWAPLFMHAPSAWIWPDDLWGSYLAASAAVHGHLGYTYTVPQWGSPPGLLIALAPFAALSGVLHTPFLQVLTSNGQVPTHPQTPVGPGLIQWPIYQNGSGSFVAHPQWVVLVLPFTLILSCVSLFAFDALAESLHFSRPRRSVLCMSEAVLLWSVMVIWGHPEDAVAVGLAVYALVFAFDGRFAGCGWLFGVAVLFQPLVLLMLPIILAIGGRQRILGLVVRSVLPAAALVAPFFVADFHTASHTLVDQPNYPNLNHQTPWTALAPRIGGKGVGLAVAGGPGRFLALVIAVGFGFWVARHWRERPAMLAFACAVELALRSYTDSGLTAYYLWAGLAVGLVLAAGCNSWRYAIGLVLGIGTTVIAQWNLAWLPWWTIQIAGLTALLVVVSGQTPRALAPAGAGPSVARKPSTHGRKGQVQSKKTSAVRARARVPTPEQTSVAVPTTKRTKADPRRQ